MDLKRCGLITLVALCAGCLPTSPASSSPPLEEPDVPPATISLPPGGFNPGMIDPPDPIFFDQGSEILAVNVFPEYDYGNFTILFFITQDGGKTWTYRSQVGDVGRMNNDHCFQAVSQQDIYFVCGNDLCASHDAALTWERITTALKWTSRESYDYVISLDFGEAYTGWALARNPDDSVTLWRTQNEGWTWTPLDPVFMP